MDERLYNRLRPLVAGLQKLLFPVQVIGVENLPNEGGAILCANHTSLLDPLVLAVRSRRPIRFMAKAELFRVWGLKTILTKLGSFPVSRGENDLSSIREALRIVKNGEILGIFPQGTRTKKGVQPPFLAGSSLVALRSGVAVYPVYINRPFRLFRRTRVVFGQKVELERSRMDAAALASATRQIEQAVWNLGQSSNPSDN